jgi:hypothetical protein
MSWSKPKEEILTETEYIPSDNEVDTSPRDEEETSLRDEEDINTNIKKIHRKLDDLYD